MIAILEKKNGELALANKQAFAVCQDVLDDLGLMENYRIAMGGENE